MINKSQKSQRGLQQIP